MSKTHVALFAILCAVAVHTPAMAAETLFKGTIKFTKKSSCDGSVTVGDVQRARYHPHKNILPTNDEFSSLNRFTPFQGTTWAGYKLLAGQTDTGTFTSTFKRVRMWTIGDVWRGTTIEEELRIPSTQLRVSSLKPAALTATSPTVIISGQIKNPYGKSGQESCVVDFVATLVNEVN